MDAKQKLIEHYEDCFVTHGDNHKGVDWPNHEDAEKRYQVMLELVTNGPNPWQNNGYDKATILDYGCGLGHLFAYKCKMAQWSTHRLFYFGYDPSSTFINHCLNKINTFFSTDLGSIPEVDYTIMCGVFTEKRGTFDDAVEMLIAEIKTAWAKSKCGIAFNVMSWVVNKEREDLFHLSLDLVQRIIIEQLGTRNFIIRNDYGLYEYTVYVYKESSL